MLAGATSELDTLSCLVIDDEVSYQILVKRILGQIGVKDVATALNGEEALDHLGSRDSQPDVLLVDLGMPKMGGAELLRRLAEQGYRGAIVLASAADEETLAIAEAVAKYRELNILGSITKPLTAPALAEVLGKLR